ncbi:hypothetical protein BH24GEM3_BH24GEM3_27100 [soil metagenome]
MEGDWVTLLLFVFFFFILPILQQVFRKKQPPPPTTQLPEEEEEWELPPHGRRDTPSRVPAPEQWSEGWEGEWPEEEETAAARERSAWEDLGLDDLFREPRTQPPEPVTAAPAPIPVPSRPLPTTPPPERLPPASPPPPQVVSMEALVVDREAEHVRFHDRYVVPSRPPAGRIRHPPLAAQIHDPKELRRAIILNEVLGLPRALRPPEA